MSEITFSKKQLNPLIEKYQINVEENVTFKTIISLFSDAPNYHIWAVKIVFENACTLPVLTQIKAWIDANSQDIKNLSKGNVVSYKTAHDIKNLVKEMEALDKIRAVRNVINKFNTRQRDMLNDALISPLTTPMDVYTLGSFKKFAPVLLSMDRLVAHRKAKLISTSSAIDNISFLFEHIKTALDASYEWNREDMLSFMERNTPDCKVVYDKENIVVLDVPSFASSKKLCGNGRTGWCLTREERYFNQYAKDASTTHQYFVFNFNHPEDHELAHIGFTVRKGSGICYAHSTTNINMMDGVSVKGKKVNIHDALRMCNIGKSVFMPLGKNSYFKWDMDSVLELVQKTPNDLAIGYNENNRLIVRALTPHGVQMLINHTMVEPRNVMQSSDKCKVYVLLDFNLSAGDDNSVVTIQYTKDKYQIDTLNRILDAYNGDLTKTKYLSSLGISTDRFLNREEINPRILLHKLIDEGQEDEAVRLVQKEGEKLDVNFEFNNRLPIFQVINQRMFKLFEVLVNHANFNCASSDSFGESLLQSLMYTFMACNSSDKPHIKRMIDIVLNSKSFDFNVQNINLDTAVNIACENPELNWVAEILIGNAVVNLNVVNDLNCTALGCALHARNIDALKMLGKRVDLVVREEDLEMAKEMGININDYIDPRPIGTLEVAKDSIELAKIFKEYFLTKK